MRPEQARVTSLLTDIEGSSRLWERYPADMLAAAHGGQVLISDSVTAEAVTALPSGSALRSLDRHRLPDLARPERVSQLGRTRLRHAFRRSGRARLTGRRAVTSALAREATWG